MGTESDSQTPKAIIHKRILEEASDQPDASLEAIAEEVPGASVDLVRRVLDQYGDPVGEQESTVDVEEQSSEPDLTEKPAPEPSSAEVASTDHEGLTTKQRETLRQINERPEATQDEIGESLGVTGATISNRLSDIAGFAWPDRQEFVSGLFDAPLIGDGHGQVEERISAEVDPRLEQLEDRLDAIESNVGGSALATELAHKVIHACMNSDDFSEEEELELIRALFDS